MMFLILSVSCCSSSTFLAHYTKAKTPWKSLVTQGPTELWLEKGACYLGISRFQLLLQETNLDVDFTNFLNLATERDRQKEKETDEQRGRGKMVVNGVWLLPDLQFDSLLQFQDLLVLLLNLELESLGITQLTLDHLGPGYYGRDFLQTHTHTHTRE